MKQGTPLIREEVERILRLSRNVREFFSPPARYGGSGVIWVILKGKKSGRESKPPCNVIRLSLAVNNSAFRQIIR